MAIARLVLVARPLRPGRLAPVAAALLMATALASCGGNSATVAKTTTTAHGKGHVKPVQPYVRIYAGLPLSGPMAAEGRAVLNGIKLAFRPFRKNPGPLLIKFKYFNNSGQKTGDDNLTLTAKHAGEVATDPNAIYYIGDLSSAATVVSLSVLNSAGIAQVTPGDPFIAEPVPPSGSSPPVPELLRILPTYKVQAAADVVFFDKIRACSHIVAFAQDDAESTALVNTMYTYAQKYVKTDGVEMAKPSQPLTGKALATTLQSLPHSTCGFVIAGNETKPAVTLAKMIHLIFPSAVIVGTSGLCSSDSAWTRGVVHQIPGIADSLLWCTSPQLPVREYASSNDFITLYKSVYHHYPSPYALYGYEAADLGISMIDYLETQGQGQGENREIVRRSLFDAQTRALVFNPYASLSPLNHGDSTQDAYGVYSVNPATGKPVFDKTLRP